MKMLERKQFSSTWKTLKMRYKAQTKLLPQGKKNKRHLTGRKWLYRELSEKLEDKKEKYIKNGKRGL